MCVVQDVDEKLLYDTFSAFGVIVTNPKVQIPTSFRALGYWFTLWVFIIGSHFSKELIK